MEIDSDQIRRLSTIICPRCGLQKHETMPTDAFRFFYVRTLSGHAQAQNGRLLCVLLLWDEALCPPRQNRNLGE